MDFDYFSSNKLFFIPDILKKSEYLFLSKEPTLTGLQRIGLYNDEPQFFHYHCNYKTKEGYNSGAGSSYNKNLAITKTIGEALERYCLLNFEDKSLLRTSFSESRESRVDPHIFNAFSNEQPFVKKETKFHYSASTKFSWIKATSLNNYKLVYIPAQLVYLFNVLKMKEPIIQFPLSTGAAAGETLEDAIYKGLCEAFERDAFMINYLNKLIGQKLLKFDSQIMQKIIAKIERYNLKVYFVDLFTDVPIHCIACIVLDYSKIGPAVTVGLSADLNIEEASISAFMEAVRIRILVRNWLNEDENKREITNITDIKKRGLFWSNKKMIPKIRFLLQGKRTNISEKKKFRFDSKHKLKLLTDWLKKQNYHIYYSDITHKNIRKTGVKVVKVIIPELVPLYLNENYPYWGSKRLYEVPKKLGLINGLFIIKNLNKIPHPFL